MSYNKEDDGRSQTSDVHGVSSAGTAESDVVAHAGVKKVEATHKVFGKYSKWMLFIRYAFATHSVQFLV